MHLGATTMHARLLRHTATADVPHGMITVDCSHSRSRPDDRLAPLEEQRLSGEEDARPAETVLLPLAVSPKLHVVVQNDEREDDLQLVHREEASWAMGYGQ